MSKDDIGDRGQWMFSLLMTEPCGRDEPYFRPRFLGDKYPTFDFILELVDRPEYYFFVQVKTTTQGYTRAPRVRLKVHVSQQDVDRMVACPAPSYVVGIDMNSGAGYIVSINEPRDHMPTLPTTFKIDCAALATLANEVHQYWASRDMVLAGSHFKE